MARTFFSILFLMVFHCVQSQHLKSFTLKAFTTIGRSQYRDSVYLYPRFQQANLTLRSGYQPNLKIKANYNLLLDCMEIMNEQGDTVRLENYQEMKVITIGNHLIYNDASKGYLEIIYQGQVSLGARHKLNPIMEASSGERFTSIDGLLATSRFDRIYEEVIDYYFLNGSGKPKMASPPAIIKSYRDKREIIKKYLKKDPVNFKSQDDLIRLLNFCAGNIADDR